MSNIFKINGDMFITAQDVLDEVNQRKDVRDIVIIVTDNEDITDIYYNRQATNALSFTARQFQIHTDQLTAMTITHNEPEMD